MNKLRIGIPGWKVGENSFGATTNHLEFIKIFGSPIILMPDEPVRKDLDMVYLPGGPDLYPASVDQAPSFHTTSPDLYKQYFYDTRLPIYIKQGTPIFGVCLGFQQLAAFFGSHITQHLPFHAQSERRWGKGHEIYAIKTSESEEFWPYKKFKVEVNSHHHQGVKLSDLSNELAALAVAEDEEAEDKKVNPIVESFVHRDLPIAGVQWHPEEWLDVFAKRLLRTCLLKAGKLEYEEAYVD